LNTAVNQNSLPTDDIEHPWYGALEFRTLAETIPSLIFVSDGHGRNIYTNTSYQRFSGKTGAALLGGGFYNVLHPDDREAARAWAAQLSETCEPFEVEQRLLRYDGEYRTHLIRGAPVKDANQKVLRWIGSCTDIHELRSAVRAAEQATGLLAALGRSTEAAVFAKDAVGQFVFANDATLKIMGKVTCEVIGASVSDHSNLVEDGVEIDVNDASVLAENRTMAFDERWTDNAGIEHVYRSSKGPWDLPDGTRGVVGVSIDVTHERLLERSILANNARFRTLFDGVPMLLWVADETGKVVVRNSLWSDFTGLPDSCEDPIVFADIIDPSDLPAFEAFWAWCIGQSELLEIELGLFDRIAAGFVKHVVRMVPVRTTDSEVTAWVGSALPV
jgi:PAS domain S-box-containing protein